MSTDERLMRWICWAFVAFFLCAYLMPLAALFSKSLMTSDGLFAGAANFATYLATPALGSSITNSLLLALTVSTISTALAFAYAYALTRSCMPMKPLFRTLALFPLFAPTMMPAIALQYLLGNQGFAKWLLGGYSVYGAIGITIGHVVLIFPVALLILTTALRTADARLYEAAWSLRTSRFRIFWNVTLPGVRYGLLSAFTAGFTISITDFSIPKIIGGEFNVLATDIYKQVVGQQNFEMGAVAGVFLLIPAVLAFWADRYITRRQASTLGARTVPLQPKASLYGDGAALLYCSVIGGMSVLMVGTCVYASLVGFWPYDLSFSLAHYDLSASSGQGWEVYVNSLILASATAIIGTAIVFLGAYLVEKGQNNTAVRQLIHFSATLPMAIPGLVLGLSYIFFFSSPQNPLNFFYGTMAILVLSSIIHYYPVCHIIALTALKQIDPEFESVSASLRAPFYKTFLRVTVPISLPAILEISSYLFMHAMTTTSAVIFIYTTDTMLSSIAILNMEEFGYTQSAAALSVLIFLSSLSIRFVFDRLSRRLMLRTQRWRLA
ncbi:putative 2-aminoethylphosphonate ABC transporter permease subunit [Aminobacter sp. UC22_36]|uniref:putative 2-aminoethylphosphonate ABC transporter permease subunit n=1 Tax=Aminobacter sp. UC22_36 TaxID=3374549 RepID=UPI003757D65E